MHTVALRTGMVRLRFLISSRVFSPPRSVEFGSICGKGARRSYTAGPADDAASAASDQKTCPLFGMNDGACRGAGRFRREDICWPLASAESGAARADSGTRRRVVGY